MPIVVNDQENSNFIHLTDTDDLKSHTFDFHDKDTDDINFPRLNSFHHDHCKYYDTTNIDTIFKDNSDKELSLKAK